MEWLLLAFAGVFEAAWALLLKQSDGFSRLWPSVGFLITAAASLTLLLLALRDLPVGTAYAVWTGIGVAGTAAFGMIVLSEPASAARIGSLVLILAGIVSLYASDS